MSKNLQYLFLLMVLFGGSACGTSGHLSEILHEQLYRKTDKDSPYPNLYAIPERSEEDRPKREQDTDLVETLEQNQRGLVQQQSPERLDIDEPDWPLE